jgi:uncharacterized protein YlzI (FlbEa/FlbD family)
MPWIEVTRRDGRRISLNSRHIATFEDVLERNTDHYTLITTGSGGKIEVAESHDTVARKLLLR